MSLAVRWYPRRDSAGKRGLRTLALTAVRGGDFVFVAGLSAADPSGEPYEEHHCPRDALHPREPEDVLGTMRLFARGIVKVNVLLHSMLEAPNMNVVFAPFSVPRPPAPYVEPAPGGAKVMIECTALGTTRKGKGGGPVIARSAVEPENPVSTRRAFQLAARARHPGWRLPLPIRYGSVDPGPASVTMGDR